MSSLDGFREWCTHVEIPSREGGIVPLSPLYPSQEYLLMEIEAGLAAGIRDFTILKGGRQSAVGGSTLMDALTIYYLQRHPGMIGLMVSDDDGNRDYRRDLMLQMLDSLPATHRQAVRRDNMRMLAWRDNPRTGYRGSRLLFAAAGKREDGNLGRSKGVNLNYNDELGFWFQQKKYSALRASRAESHPLRFFADISTANGIGTVFHNEWKIATDPNTVTRRGIFVACWRNQGVVTRILTDDPRWEVYGEGPLTREEREWSKEIKRRYDFEVTRAFWAWYRWKLTEEMGGDETLMRQEFGVLPEECFQSFGDKFIEPGIVSRLHREAQKAPRPKGYRYEWGAHLDTTDVRKADPSRAPLRVWEEPDPAGVYVVAAHPWGSSSEHAKEYVVQVWRAWPDRLVQVAEYAADGGYMHKFAWVCLHLCGVYRTLTWAYFVMEITGPGKAAFAEIERVDRLTYGVTAGDRDAAVRIVSMIQAARYLYRRLDSFTSSVLKDTQIGTSVQERMRVLYALRDEIERGHVVPRSPELIDHLARLRRGEQGDADEIGGGAEQEESRAICCALAVEAWLSQAMNDLMVLLPRREPEEGQAPRLENVMVGDFLRELGRQEEA